MIQVETRKQEFARGHLREAVQCLGAVIPAGVTLCRWSGHPAWYRCRYLANGYRVVKTYDALLDQYRYWVDVIWMDES